MECWDATLLRRGGRQKVVTQRTDVKEGPMGD
jgi:hypothetical protein